MAFIMLRELKLAGVAYRPGQEIPETVWDGLRERSRRSLLAGRYVTERAAKAKKRASSAVPAPKSTATIPAGAPMGPGQPNEGIV